MLRPRVELSTTGDMVNLVCDQNGGHAHELDADEAWNLGDDLVTAGLELMDKQGKLQYWLTTELPQWSAKVHVTSQGGPPDLECDDHGIFQHLGFGFPLHEVIDMAREHWKLMHSNVAQDAEGEDEDGQPVPAVDDPAVEADAGGDAEDHRDQVKERSQHVVWNTRPADRGNRIA